MTGFFLLASIFAVVASGAIVIRQFWRHGIPAALLRPFNDIRFQLQSSAIYAVPLRIFIGLGWLRAGVEKVIDGNWRSGEATSTFLADHLRDGHIAFGFYETLVSDVFLPAATAMAIIIIVGELLAGAAILSGTFTNAALLGGIFMNLNFLLAGETNPSAFYLIIQMTLLVTGAGSVLGFDRVLSRTWTQGWLVAQPAASLRSDLRPYFAGIGLSLVVAIYAAFHVQTTDPRASVEDPAMLLVILSLLSCFWLVIAIARARVDRLPYLALPSSEHSSTTPQLHLK